jgi:hypothetical protein
MSGPVKDYSDAEKARLHARLVDLYTKYAPENIGSADKALTMNVSEAVILEKIYAKYKIDQATEEAEARAKGLLPASSTPAVPASSAGSRSQSTASAAPATAATVAATAASVAAAAVAAAAPVESRDADWVRRLEMEKRATTQLAARNEALLGSQQFVVERAADFALQQQQRIAELETQLGAVAPPAADETPMRPINVRHGCPRCATCTTLLQTVSQLELMLQHRDSDCDALRKALDDAHRVNALLLEQIDMLQRGLEKAIAARSIPAAFAAPPAPAHSLTSRSAGDSPRVTASVAPPSTHDSPPPHALSTAQVPTHVRMLTPSSDPTLRAMADAVSSLEKLWLLPQRASPPPAPAPRL